MAHGKVKLSVMVEAKTADEIDRISKCWNMSLSGVMRFMLKHYLKFGIKNIKTDNLERKLCQK